MTYENVGGLWTCFNQLNYTMNKLIMDGNGRCLSEIVVYNMRRVF